MNTHSNGRYIITERLLCNLSYYFYYYYNVPFKKEIDEEKYKSQNAVKDRGKHVEHAYFKAASSVALRKACDKYTTLNDDFLSSCFI